MSWAVSSIAAFLTSSASLQPSRQLQMSVDVSVYLDPRQWFSIAIGRHNHQNKLQDFYALLNKHFIMYTLPSIAAFAATSAFVSNEH